MNYDNPRVEHAAAAIGLPSGRVISQSKRAYRERFPFNVVIYNATIADDEGIGAWLGDLDLTIDETKLQALAVKLGSGLHVLHEGDTVAPAIAESHRRSDISLSAIHLTAAGETVLGRNLDRWLTRNEHGALVRRPPQ